MKNTRITELEFYRNWCKQLAGNDIRLRIGTTFDGASDFVFTVDDTYEDNDHEWIQKHPETVIVRVGYSGDPDRQVGGPNDTAVWRETLTVLLAKQRLWKITYA